MKLYYGNELLAEVTTNHSMSIEDILELCNIDMDDYASINGFDDWDYEALWIEA